MRRALSAAAMAAALLTARPAAAQDDLRGLSVGMAQSALPAGGFAGFRCAAAPDIAVDGWAGWRSCPADAEGRHALRFSYAQGETAVAGHPVSLTADLAEDGHLAALHIDTDSAARLFLHKKAFLLGLQAIGRYGEDGWTCADGAPGADAEPVGGVFIQQTCRKTLPGKALTVQRNLFRRPGTDLQQFIGESRITIVETR